MNFGFLDERFPSFKLARRNLTRTPLRSGLAALGIVIGVVAIASLGMFATSLQVNAEDVTSETNSQVSVNPGPAARDGRLSERDVQDVGRAVPGATVIPQKQIQVPVSAGRDNSLERASVVGVERPDAYLEASEGQVPASFQSGVLVDSLIAETLEVEVGERVEIDGRSTRVRAVVDGGGFSANLYVPIQTVEADGYSSVIVIPPETQTANETATTIRERLNVREERVQVPNPDLLSGLISGFFDILRGFLTAIGSISLIVAGVSILNVMLMSTIERRQEIGVLRAVGFQRRDILKILLSESMLLGVIGGLVGAVVSIVVSLGVNYYLVDDAMLTFHPRNLGVLVIAFVFGIVTSIGSGLYPAWKAANEQPVEALRS
ncbi:putative ABC transport system permease protein [Halogranum rubrum]|uniref:Putative ABC transport system permease protein n=1 Tax=Halogranum rubrum TaxID=553466 RepID=A0A1I4HZA8_9EURY|nr:FtsX-like permease family protein [Halogranum rubrum]SFL46836.1 putative ABC transport system permease protein [Halogranum rubrum]